MVERTWQRSSQISQKSRRSGSESGASELPVVDHQDIEPAESGKQTAQTAVCAIARSRNSDWARV